MKYIYAMSGFSLRFLKMDPEFKTLHSELKEMQILLNATGQGDHVPEAERFFRTTKDSSWASFAITPFKKLPFILSVGLILDTAFGGNSVVFEHGVFRTLSPE